MRVLFRGNIVGVRTINEMRTTLLLSLVAGAASREEAKALIIVSRCYLSFAKRVFRSMVAPSFVLAGVGLGTEGKGIFPT